jgi:hypothetical protein
MAGRSGAVEAHSLRGDKASDLTPPLKAYFEEIASLEKDIPIEATPIRGVLDQFKLWSARKTLMISFMDGDRLLRDVFVHVSQRWLPGMSLKMDFGSAPSYRTCTGTQTNDIKVSFSWGGNWSYVGTDSLLHLQERATLNIGYAASGRLSSLSRKKLKGIILHEVGHALGLQHEHQSPEANCDNEFDWPKVYEYGETVWNWSKREIDLNMKALVSSDRFTTTPYDRRSIMHYYFEPILFKKGTASPCFVGHNQSAVGDGQKNHPHLSGGTRFSRPGPSGSSGSSK